jgi:hypothetical protein
MLKPLLIVAVILTAVTKTQAQDDHFEFYSPFGSDGTNQPGLSVQERNEEVSVRLWESYVRAREEINKPFPKASPNGYSQAYSDRCRTILRYGDLLEAMAELRAFTTQNPAFVVGNEKNELMRIDRILRSLGVRYTASLVVSPATGRPAGSGQQMVDYCDRVGPDKVEACLRPLLFRDNGLPRPIPSWQSVQSHQMGFD